MGIFYDPECSRSVYDITGALWLILFAALTKIRANNLRRGRGTRYETQIRAMRNVNKILILRPQDKKSLQQYAGIPSSRFSWDSPGFMGFKKLCPSVPQNLFRDVKCPFLLKS
jgi:hypothetical protein